MPKRPEHRAPTLPLDVEEPSLDLHAAPEPAVETTPEVSEPAEDSLARFEQDLQELETIVQQMERGELRLEDSLRLFERGMALSKACRRSLDTAELKVRTLGAQETGDEDA